MHKRSAWRFATPLACINFAIMNPIIVNDSDLRRAAAEGMDAFLDVFVNAYKAACGSELSAEAFGLLTPDQITLWGYAVLREEVMDGGFVQLIHNGYGPFFFHNPFAKALKLWGVDDLARLIRRVDKQYRRHRDVLTADCTEAEFMALFEQYPEFDDHDDAFIEGEASYTAQIAAYVDEHLDNFATIHGKE